MGIFIDIGRLFLWQYTYCEKPFRKSHIFDHFHLNIANNYRMDKTFVEKEKKIYGLIGKSLKHSFSRKYFLEKFSKEKIHADYLNWEINDVEEIYHLIDKYPGIEGFNVTIPFKEAVINHLHWLTEEAKDIGAVNTVKVIHIKKGILLTGHNTDATAFEDTLKPLLGKHHNKALILGSGGASKAVGYVLRKLNIDFLIVSRKASFQKNFITYDQISKDIMEQYPLIINTTPMGMFPQIHVRPSLPVEYFNESHLVYDLIYNPENTLLMQEAKRRGATAVNGLQMLYRQADLAWEYWNNCLLIF